MTSHLEIILATIRDCVDMSLRLDQHLEVSQVMRKNTNYIELTVSTEGAVTRVALHPHKTWVSDHLFCYL